MYNTVVTPQTNDEIMLTLFRFGSQGWRRTSTGGLQRVLTPLAQVRQFHMDVHDDSPAKKMKDGNISYHVYIFLFYYVHYHFSIEIPT